MRRQLALPGRTLVICGGTFVCLLAQQATALGDPLEDRRPPAQSEANPKTAPAEAAAANTRYKLTLVKWTDKRVASRGGGGTVYRARGFWPDGSDVAYRRRLQDCPSTLWNIETGEMDRYFDIFDMGQDGSPLGVAIGPDGNKAALVTSRNKLYLVELDHRKFD